MKAKTNAKAVGDDYLQLVQQFPLRAIRTPADANRATAFIEPLVLKGEDGRYFR